MDETAYSQVLILALIFNAVLMSVILFICVFKDIVVGVASQCCKKNQIANHQDISRLSTRESSLFIQEKAINQFKTQKSILKKGLVKIQNDRFLIT